MQNFSDLLLQWYLQNKRDLPWRNTSDPYLIWISEIILQQTQVQTGLSYFYKITERFPNVEELATATEDEVLKMWQGMGYYSRARNMLTAAKQISEIHDGVFPSDYDEIIKLKGVGIYTAAAIASFAYNMPFAVIDGNVYRLLSRVFAISDPIDGKEGKKVFFNLADQLLNKTKPGLHNQAIMELGSQVCKPANPLCENCPLTYKCIAKEKNLIGKLPVKSKKTVQKKRYLTYLYVRCNNNLFIVNKRTQNDIWKGLYQFPLIETAKSIKNSHLEDMIKNTFPFLSLKKYKFEPDIIISHKLTHQILTIQFVTISISRNTEKLSLPKGFEMVAPSDIPTLAFPKPIEIFLEKTIHPH